MRKVYFIVVCLFLSAIVYSQALVRRLPSDTATCLSSMVLNAGNVGASYLWSTGATTQSITVSNTGSWGVTVSNATSTITSASRVSFFQQPTAILRDTTVCVGVRTVQVGGNAQNFHWYSSSTATQPIYSGLGFSNNFTSSVTYWIQPLNSLKLGSVGEISNDNKPKLAFSGNRGTLFDCNSNLIIDTVYVYAVSVPSTITIDLYQNSTLLTSKTFTVTALGKFPLALNFEIQPGSNYNLTKRDGGNSFYLGDNSTYLYPYKLFNKISLKSYSFGSVAFSGYYSYFYDWKISEVVCKGTRNPLNVNVLNAPVILLPSDTTVCGVNVANLTANLSSQNTYNWSTGQTTSTISVQSNGFYSVTATNSSCSTTKRIAVQMFSPVRLYSTLDTTICDGVNALNLTSNKRAYWYKKNATTPFNTGSSYSKIYSSGIDSSWIEFVDAINLGTIGESTNNNSIPFNGFRGTNFDVLEDLILDSISVYAVNANSSIEIELYKDNTLLKSRVYAIANSGLNRLLINWDIPRGTNYKLMKKMDANMFNLGNTAAYNYPYQIPNVIKLNGYQNGIGSVLTQLYSYFYNWRIAQKKCVTAKQLFKVTVLPIPTSPLTDTLTCGLPSLALDAQNTGATYVWSTGSTTQIITVSANGNYVVTMTNGGRCTTIDTARVQMFTRPNSPTLAPLQLCQAGSISLLTPLPNEGYTWYRGATTAQPYFVGSPYRPFVTNDTTFFVQASSMASGYGGLSAAPSASVTYSSFGIGTLFNVSAPLVLDSIAVYANRVPCTFNVLLYSPQGDLLGSFPANVSVAAQKTFISLGKTPLAVGNGYRMSFTNLSGGTLALSPISYPNVSPRLTLVGNTVGNTTTNYYFYDWRYSYPVDFCSSPRVSVPIDLILPTNLPDTLRDCRQTILSIPNVNPNASYRWSTASTTTTITATQAGTYYVTVTGQGCTATDSTLVIIPQKVGLPPSTILCGTLLKTNYSTLPNIAFLWSNGKTTNQITVTAPGTYKVTVNEPGGCVLIDSVSITRLSSPPTINLPSFRAFCQNANFDVTTPNARYLWSDGRTTPQVTFNSGNNAQVTVTNADGCAASAQTNYQIESQPQAAFTYQPSPTNPLRIQFTNTSIGNTTNYWDFGIANSSALSPSFTFNSSGSYQVQLVVGNSCGTTTVTQMLVLPLATENTETEAITLYPNPNSGSFTLNIPETLISQPLNLTIHNAYGQVVLQQTLKASSAQSLPVKLGNSAGMYFIQLTDTATNKTWYTRFVINP